MQTEMLIAMDLVEVGQIDSSNALSTVENLSKALNLTTTSMSVVSHEHFRTSKNVAKFVEFLDRDNPKLLTLITHLRKQKTFRFGGGFASQMVERSRFPVLVVDARALPVKSFSTVIFATDFSSHNHRAFDVAMTWAKDLDADLIIFNALLGMPSQSVGSESLAGGLEQIDVYLRSERARAEESASRWESVARSRGVRVSTVLETSASTVPRALLKSALAHSADLIVMNSQTSAKSSVFFGSITREVLRTGGLPVLVVN